LKRAEAEEVEPVVAQRSPCVAVADFVVVGYSPVSAANLSRRDATKPSLTMSRRRWLTVLQLPTVSNVQTTGRQLQQLLQPPPLLRLVSTASY
jgi:hypothetical protein